MIPDQPVEVVVEMAWNVWGFGPADAATVVAAVLGAAIAAWIVVVGYRRQKEATRREERVAVYAEALRTVEDYLEAPYLILRSDGSHQARMDLVRHLSAIQSRIEFHRAWLQIHAAPASYAAYEELVRCAKAEAGKQMTDAWRSRPTRRDWDVPIGTALPHPRSDVAKAVVLDAMRTEVC
jgi:hypothetical protein